MNGIRNDLSILQLGHLINITDWSIVFARIISILYSNRFKAHWNIILHFWVQNPSSAILLGSSLISKRSFS